MPNTCSQNRQSIKFQNHENINFVEKLCFLILFIQEYIAKHVLKSLHSGFIFREIQIITKLKVNEQVSYIISSSLTILRSLCIRYN